MQPTKKTTERALRNRQFIYLSITNLFLIISLLNGARLNAQNIGINGTGATAHPSALLDIDAVSTPSLGILIPRIPLQAINLSAPVNSPATSLLVYNTASASTGTNAVSAGYYYWDGTKWVRFAYNSSGSSSTAWDLLGNAGTNPTTNFLGTTDAQDLVLRTNNIEKMRVATTGNVGIGTPAPLVKLQVEGASNNLMNLVNTSSSINVPAWQNYIQFSDGTLNAGYVGEGSGGKLMSLVGHYGHGVTLASFQGNTAGTLNSKIDLLAGGNSSIRFNTKNTDHMIIDSVGKVGIGTMTPYSKLDVHENTGTSEIRITSWTPVKYGELIFSSSNPGFLNRGASIEGNGEGIGIDVGALIFKTQYGGTPRTEQMRINSIGNVGIGTTTPGDKLSVFGRGEFVTTLADHGVRVKGDPTNSQSIYQFTNYAGTIQWANIVATPNGGGDLTFSTQFSPKMIITSAGYVGIGTLTPSYNLHVAGVSYIDGKCIAERAGASNPMFEARKTDAGAGSMMLFLTNGGITGEISTSGVSTAYNTTSDFRLKENIKQSTKGINDIMKIAVKEYNYKADQTNTTETGFIAQELYEIYPQAVHKGGENAKTNPWMIDYSKLTPLLIKGMQEQQAQLKLQEEKIEKLEKQNAEILELLKKK